MLQFQFLLFTKYLPLFGRLALLPISNSPEEDDPVLVNNSVCPGFLPFLVVFVCWEHSSGI